MKRHNFYKLSIAETNKVFLKASSSLLFTSSERFVFTAYRYLRKVVYYDAIMLKRKILISSQGLSNEGLLLGNCTCIKKIPLTSFKSTC